MAVDMFIKIGDIKGEAQDKTHKDEIDVLSWSWGVSNSGTTHYGSGSGGGRASFQDISLTSYYDKSTHQLMKSATLGDHIKECILTCRRAGGKQNEYIKYVLKDCLITSVSTGGSGGEDRLTVNFTINFGELDFLYTEQTAAGGKGAQIPFKYDIAAQENK